MLRSLKRLPRVGRTYVVWNPDAETKSLFTKAIFNPETEAENLLHPYLSTLPVYDSNGARISIPKQKRSRSNKREDSTYAKQSENTTSEDTEKLELEIIPSAVSKWTNNNARRLGLPIESRVLRATGKLPSEMFKLEPLPERLQPFVDNVPSIENVDDFEEFLKYRNKLREGLRQETDSTTEAHGLLTPESDLTEAISLIFTAQDEAVLRSQMTTPAPRGNPELATCNMAKMLVDHIMDLPRGMFSVRQYNFTVMLDNGMFFSSTPDGTMFRYRKAVAFFDEEKPAKHNRYDNAQSFGEALTIALYNQDRGIPTQVLPQMRLFGHMFTFSLYLFTPDYLKAVKTATVMKETKGAHAYHLVWKGKQYGLNLCVKSERILAFQCLVAASKYIQNPTPDAFPLLENVLKKIV